MENKVTQKAELRIVRQFKAPQSLVFNAFASKEAFAEWWGPKGSELTVLRFDFREGGSTHYKLDNRGMLMWALFRYQKIRESDSIEFLSSFTDPEGNITSSPFPMDFPLEIYNHITLSETNGITTLTLYAEPVNATPAQEKTFTDLNPSMNQGYEGTWGQLDTYLAKVQG
ncbi:MAG: activator of HSP90 ATPase [Dyadobacter sp. 50-39]|uniref:SRPBCC family protein n=1 Tax=Dyadobacter sp. 50-39 TaxID=1895756 RepID=UPI0009690CE5|nr:SRPBCC domain-containing protein [Dyadobacter sp. 50-39]OJV12350.1 MAG: activator of HSP90 ATPase [Dyadobacter sp. 50-39]